MDNPKKEFFMANLNIDKNIDNSTLNGLLAQRASVNKNDKHAVAALSARLGEEIVMKANYLAVVNFSKPLVKGENGEMAMQHDTNMNFILLDSSNAGKYFPVFTDKNAIDKWGGVKDYHTVQITFDNLADFVLTGKACNGMIINVGTDNLVIERNVVAGWYERKQISVKGHASSVITGDTPLELYPLNPFPQKLADKLKNTAGEIEQVNRLWLHGITLNGEQGYLLVADFSDDRQLVFSKLGEASKEFLGALPLHIVPFSDEFGKKTVEELEPFYSKG